MRTITFARHTGGIKDEVIEHEVPDLVFRSLTEYPLIRIGETIYQRDSRDRSVYFSIEVLNLTAQVVDKGMK